MFALFRFNLQLTNSSKATCSTDTFYGSKANGRDMEDLRNLNKFGLPKTEYMPFLILYCKLQG